METQTDSMIKTGTLLTDRFVNIMKVDGDMAWFIGEFNPSIGSSWQFVPDNSGVYELEEEICLAPATHAVGLSSQMIWKFKGIRSGQGTMLFKRFPSATSECFEELFIKVEVE